MIRWEWKHNVVEIGNFWMRDHCAFGFYTGAGPSGWGAVIWLGPFRLGILVGEEDMG